MNLLAFETSTPSGGVALLVDGLVAGQLVLNNSQAHSRWCLRFAEILLESAGLRWRDLDVIATSHGPGSFVGLRVGLTLTKGIAWAHGLRAVSVSSLESLAAHAWAGGADGVECVVPLADARIGEVYGAIFAPGPDGRLVRHGDDCCTPLGDLLARLPGRALFAGEGAMRYAGELAGHGVLAPADRLRASPVATAMLAHGLALSGVTSTAAELAAVYLRDPVKAR